MNINSLTIKAQEVLQSAMNLASGNGNQAVEPLHILSAIVAEDDSLGVFLLQKLGVNVGALRSVLKQQIDRLPKVEGGDPYFSRESSAVIQKASDFTKTFGDKYASVEHLLLGIIAEKQFFRAFPCQTALSLKCFLLTLIHSPSRVHPAKFLLYPVYV